MKGSSLRRKHMVWSKTVEINGNVTLEDRQTDTHVNIELEFCEL